MEKIEAAFGQAAELVPLAKRTLVGGGLEFANLSHVAAGCGPGSFTGLRVSLAAAKGVCLAHDIPGIGISGLEALAFSSSAALNGLPVLCLADTRRGNVYGQLFTSDIIPEGPIFEASIFQLPSIVSGSICANGIMLAGFEIMSAKEAFAASGLAATPVTSEYARDEVIIDAGMIAMIAADKISYGNFPPLVPLYVSHPRLGPAKRQPKG